MVKTQPLATYKQCMQRLGQDLNGCYAQLVRAVKLVHPTRLSNNFELEPLPDSVFNIVSLCQAQPTLSI